MLTSARIRDDLPTEEGVHRVEGAAHPAVFHFLIDAADRAAYAALLTQTVPPGGHAVIATFALDGPQECSGLAVRRYDGPTLAAQLGAPFELLRSVPEMHLTASGQPQPFQYCLFRRVESQTT